MDRNKKQEYDVIIIGGGITGAGTARDCAMRGLRVLLVEKYDFTNGATGRNHGLLHSGARYAVTDGESAKECIQENMTLRKIARHCVDETDGLFITLPEDDLNYQATFVESCRKAGIRADVISPEEARRIEPAVNPDLIGAVRVPDASIDPFRLTTANIIDARRRGAGRTRPFGHQRCWYLGARGGQARWRHGQYVSGQGHTAHLRPPRQQHGDQPLPQTGQRRYSRAGRHGLRHRNDERPRAV